MTIVNQLKKILHKLTGKPTADHASQTISGLLGEISEHIPTADSASGGNGTTDHNSLRNRGAADQHPIEAITGLQEALNSIPQPMTAEELNQVLEKY